MSRVEILDRLETVNDPHVPVSLRRMGMLQAIDVSDDGAVEIALVVPCLGCPAVEFLREQVRAVATDVAGVSDVRVEVSWGAHWRREDVDPQAHPMLRQFGLQI